MRRRIFLVVMAATSLVVLAFVLPLLFTVRTLAEQQVMADADHQVGNVGALIASGVESQKLDRVLDQINAEGGVELSALMPDGTVAGAPGLRTDDPDVQFALTERRSGSVVDETGGRVFLTVVAGDEITVVRGALTPDQLYAGVRESWLRIIGLGAALMVVSAIMALRLGRRASEQLTEVADVATRLREGDLTTRAEVGGTVETVELARTLNDMASRQTQLIETERTAMALSHRLRTMLISMRMDAASVTDHEVGRRLIENIDALTRSTDAVSRQGMRTAVTHEPTSDAVEVVGERGAFWQRLANQGGRTIQVRLPEQALRVAIPADQLADLVDVLVDNVFTHTPAGTAFSIEVLEEAGNAVIVVSDGGTGAAAEKPTTEGPRSGNGLEIAQRTARDAGGELKVRWSTPQGTEVAATLPLVPDPALARAQH
jgi:signal transduction histidine kinase